MKFSGATIRVRKSGVVAFVAATFVAATFVVATFVVTTFVVTAFAVTAMMMAAAVAAVVVTTRTGSPSLMAEAGGKFLKGDTASFISVESSCSIWSGFPILIRAPMTIHSSCRVGCASAR